MVRIAAFVIGAVAIALAIPAQRLNIAFLVALAFAVAASANLPALLFNLFWRRFNTVGRDLEHLRRADRRGGPGVLLPGGLGTPTSLIPSVNFAWFPLRNPGLVSIPIGFLCGILGTILSKDTSSQAQLRRAGGPLADRRRSGEGSQTLESLDPRRMTTNWSSGAVVSRPRTGAERHRSHSVHGPNVRLFGLRFSRLGGVEYGA